MGIIPRAGTVWLHFFRYTNECHWLKMDFSWRVPLEIGIGECVSSCSNPWVFRQTKHHMYVYSLYTIYTDALMQTKHIKTYDST